jgi:uncharacterized protein DUF6527
MRLTELQPAFVEFIPDELTEGVLYISRRYNTATHLCCCGCRREVVTPLNPAKWRLSEHPDGTVSLMPSVGNWGFPCKSHYWISKSHVQWSYEMSPQQIAAVQARDLRDAQLLSGPRSGFANLWAACARVIAAIKSLLK